MGETCPLVSQGNSVAALTRAGRPDLASPWCGEVPVGRAGSGRPSQTGGVSEFQDSGHWDSLNRNEQHLSVFVLISRHIVDQF